ncbi:aminodeoxychorismate synthase component I [Rufibacter glacialis]|uniref:aminodeoxychorismate synthase n=1 Tax=Rufibacter glacialis TaxID=1259555 RepID=A0A5M8QEB5_9BACT|nr:aminodeoxychorismate synthase component I [Rufibacter glacialis]KAA6434385.1 aminodeoxychorismate synthase component I [Rufibacter glacialis]GGK69087.1 para-aminobenzoate synthase [Rufibacter glacialis]
MRQLSLPVASLPLPVQQWKQQALAWAEAGHQVVAYYEPNDIPYRHGAFQNLLGVRRKAQDLILSWSALQENLVLPRPCPLMGYLTYDLKNGLEKLHSQHPDYLGFPELTFFAPETWITFSAESITISSTVEEPEAVAQAILATSFTGSFSQSPIQTQARVAKEDYLQTVEQLRQHILEGDVYEVNYCQEFYAEEVRLSPLPLFWKLNQASPTPFAGFLKLEDRYLLCASPERFLKKEGNVLISQPIKGTIRRGNTPQEDEHQRQLLASSEKEQAENMMIVDLVRNDLNRVASTGTVQVEELFGLYGFRYVWQMISTVTGQVPDSVSPVEVLKATFPMGSMTGAPKIRALELIEQYEQTKRGLYSGSLGYFLPNGDFDFNVVIRSLQYNAQSGYLSFEVGSAITYDSDPEQEYQECLLKAEAINQVLQNLPR